MTCLDSFPHPLAEAHSTLHAAADKPSQTIRTSALNIVRCSPCVISPARQPSIACTGAILYWATWCPLNPVRSDFVDPKICSNWQAFVFLLSGWIFIILFGLTKQHFEYHNLQAVPVNTVTPTQIKFLEMSNLRINKTIAQHGCYWSKEFPLNFFRLHRSNLWWKLGIHWDKTAKSATPTAAIRFESQTLKKTLLTTTVIWVDLENTKLMLEYIWSERG